MIYDVVCSCKKFQTMRQAFSIVVVSSFCRRKWWKCFSITPVLESTIGIVYTLAIIKIFTVFSFNFVYLFILSGIVFCKLYVLKTMIFIEYVCS